MLFGAPAAFLLIALVLPIVALYILKIRLRRIPVSTNLFWKQVYDENPPRSLWQQLRHWLSLLAQLALLLILVLSIADPYFSWQSLQARRLVFVLDTSASMRASDIAPSRFEAARDAAHQMLDGLRSRDQVAVVSAGSRPEVVLGMTGHVPTLRRAVDSIHLTDAASSLDAAIELGKQLIGDHPKGQVLVFTDGCAQRIDSEGNPVDVKPSESTATQPTSAASSESTLSATANKVDLTNIAVTEPAQTIEVQYRTFATTAGNVGLTQFQARRSLVDAIGYEILVKVRNASDQPVKGRLELELDDVAIDVIPLSLKPEEQWTRVIEKTSLEGGQLKASLTQITLDRTDANVTNNDSLANVNWLPTDDTAWAIVPPRVVQRVLIVSPGNLFLQKVFEANPLVQVSVRNDLPDEWPADTIVVCHRLVPATLPVGDVLVVDPETSCDLWDVGDVLENPIVTEQDETSALMTHIRMDNVLMPEARRLEFKTTFKSLASTVTGEPVYAVIHRSQGDCLVLSVNLERSDLAFRTAFPILVTNALSWFAGLPGELQPSISAGQMTSLSLGDDLADAEGPAEGATRDVDLASEEKIAPTVQRTLVSPSQQQFPLLGNQVGPLSEVGVWSVIESNMLTRESVAEALAERVLQHVAVNLANENESDLRPEDTPPSSIGTSVMSGDWFTRPTWFYLIVGACVLSTLEWFLYQRRFIT